jgi:hypothetical protein
MDDSIDELRFRNTVLVYEDVILDLVIFRAPKAFEVDGITYDYSTYPGRTAFTPMFTIKY